jgi:hypothetical protein
MTTHRMSFAPEYFAWSEMRHRCRNPNHRAFENYGGRGIRVCERWAAFEAFYADMGPLDPALAVTMPSRRRA